MNKMAMTLLISLTASSAFARKITKPTIYTCQQADGDQWLEVGIAKDATSGLRAFIVAHDTDNGSTRLIANSKVSAMREMGKSIYIDADRNFRIDIAQKGKNLVADFELSDSGVSLKETEMSCHENNSISWNSK